MHDLELPKNYLPAAEVWKIMLFGNVDVVAAGHSAEHKKSAKNDS